MSFETLVNGLDAFQQEDHGQRADFYAGISTGQSPKTAMVACADSRLDPYRLTRAEPGDLFLIKNAGNFVPACTAATIDSTIASLEFAVCALGVEHLVVCGHSDCGAMKALMSGEPVPGMPAVNEWIGEFASSHTPTSLDLENFTKWNIQAQMANLRAHPFVADRLETGQISVHGWYYPIAKGQVEAFDAKTETFVAAAALYKTAG